MPQGDKSKYTDKQKREAEHIEQGYEKRGTPKKKAEAIAWATVNKITGGGKKPGGSGVGKKNNKAPAKRGGKIGSGRVSHETRVSAGKKAAKTKAKS